MTYLKDPSDISRLQDWQVAIVAHPPLTREEEQKFSRFIVSPDMGVPAATLLNLEVDGDKALRVDMRIKGENRRGAIANSILAMLGGYTCAGVEPEEVQIEAMQTARNASLPIRRGAGRLVAASELNKARTTADDFNRDLLTLPFFLE